MSKEDNEVRRILAYIGGQEKIVKTRVLGMFKRMRASDVIHQFEEFYKAYKFQPIIAMTDVFVEDAADVVDEVFANAGDREMRVLAGKFEVQRVRKAIEVDPSVSLGFDVGNAEVARALRKARMEFIREITESLRDTIRETLRYAQLNGLGAVQASRLFKNSLPLTSFQNGVVNNYRRLLETGNLDALTRALRDRRFDSTIRSTFTSGRLLNKDQIDRMVDRYRSRMVDMRAETIARTETGAVVESARYEALGQMTQQIGLKQSEVTRTWRAVLDGRTRDTHYKMNGQQRKGKKPFTLPSGYKIRFPRDRNAPAGEVINCRCTVLISLRDVTEVQQQQVPANAIASQPPVIIDTGGVLDTDAFVPHPSGSYYVPKTLVDVTSIPKTPISNFKTYRSGYEKVAQRLYKDGLTQALSATEKLTLEEYTGSSYHRINKCLTKMLRDPGSVPPVQAASTSKDILKLESAMSKASLPESLVVYRNLGFGQRFTDMVKNLMPSETFLMDKAFISTTINPKMTRLFGEVGQRLKILVPKGSRAISVSPISEFSKEAEVLLDKNSMFVVRSVTEKEITLELVPPKTLRTAGSTVKPIKKPMPTRLGVDDFVEHPGGSYYIPREPYNTPELSGNSFRPVVANYNKVHEDLHSIGFTSVATKEETLALVNYTTGGFEPINKLCKILRSPNVPSLLSETWKPYINRLDSLMGKASFPRNMIVYRGIEDNTIIQRLLKHAEAGDTVLLDKGFISTSIHPEAAKVFSKSQLHLEIHVPKGAKAFSVGLYTDYVNEFEVILNRNSMFVVKEKTATKLVVELVL